MDTINRLTALIYIYIYIHNMHTCTAAQKFGIRKIFLVCKEGSSAHQGCIYSIKNTDFFFILWNIIAIHNNSFLFSYTLKYNLFCDQSCIFSIITPVFSVTWSSEITLIYWFIINVRNCCADSYHFNIINKKLKRTAFILKRNVVLQYTTLFKSLGSVHFSFFKKKEMNTFIQEGCVKW